MKEHKTYSQEFKDKLIQESLDTGNVSLVSEKYNIPHTTLHGWIRKSKTKSPVVSSKKQISKLQKELKKKEIEIEILKELLKKTNQAWLNV